MNLKSKILLFLILCSTAFGAIVYDDIKPSPTQTYDLGSAALEWEDAFFNGNVDAGTFTGNGAALTGITGATGGISNAGSTSIIADNDGDASGVIALQIGNPAVTMLEVTNAGNIDITNAITSGTWNGDAIDISDYTNLTVSSPLTLTDDALAWDQTLIDNITWSDGANASNVWTFDVSGTDQTITFGNAITTFSGTISDGTLSILAGDISSVGTISGAGNAQIDFVDDSPDFIKLGDDGHWVKVGGDSLANLSGISLGDLQLGTDISSSFTKLFEKDDDEMCLTGNTSVTLRTHWGIEDGDRAGDLLWDGQNLTAFQEFSEFTVVTTSGDLILNGVDVFLGPSSALVTIEGDGKINQNLTVSGTITGNLTGNVIGNLTGNADTAELLLNTRTFSISGDTTAPGVTFNGGGNVDLVTSIAAGSIVDGDVSVAAAINADKLADGITNAIVTLTQESSWDTHLTSDGSDHSFIDQSVISGSSPTFVNTNMTGNISVWTNDSGYLTSVSSETVEDIVGGMVTGNTEVLIAVTYQDVDGTLDFVVDEASISHDALTNFLGSEHFIQPNISQVGTISIGVWEGTPIDISDRTNLIAGTNLTLVNDTINLDNPITTDVIGTATNVVDTNFGDVTVSGGVWTVTTVSGANVPLGTGTTGDYVSNITGGAGIDSTGATTGETISHTLSFDSTELDALTWSDGTNASNIWTFNVSGSDHTMTAGNGLMTFSDDVAINGLTASLGVYTDSSKVLTSTPPTSGVLGYWSRAGTVISTATAGDDITTTGLTTTNTLQITEPTGDGFKFGGVSNRLYLQSQTSGVHRFELYTKDGDFGDFAQFIIFAQGIPTSQADSSSLTIGYSPPQDSYFIKGNETGNGDFKNLIISADGTNTQMVFDEDTPLITTSGDFTVGADLQVDVDLNVDGATTLDETTVTGDLTVTDDIFMSGTTPVISATSITRPLIINTANVAATVSGFITIVTGNASGSADSGCVTIDTGTAAGTVGSVFLDTGGINAVTIDENQITHIGDGTNETQFSATGDLSFAGTAKLTLPNKTGSTTEGDLWKDTAQKSIQGFIAGVEQALIGCIFTQTADQTIADTTTETTMFGTGVGTLTLPANFWTVGKTIRFEIHGDFADTGNPTAQVQVYQGATSLIDSGAITLSGLTGTEEWETHVIITCRSVGATGTLETIIDWEYETTTGSSAIERLDVQGTTTVIDTTASQVLDATFQWGTAAAANTLTSEVGLVEVLN